jgi:nitrate/TMAO reductase-like tetraheme cytochrome c subunit
MSKGKTALVLGAALFAGVMTPGAAQEVQHLTVTQPGGFPGLPILTGISKITNGVSITWDGPAGYYQLFSKPALTSPVWQPVGAPNLARVITLTNIVGNALFKVAGPSPQFAGSAACAECHEGVHTVELNTRHARALETLKKIGQGNNASCLPCHTVGHGLPTGFTTEFSTPHLAGVQCESCHGPAAEHAANEMDLTRRPRKEIAGQLCGGCHTGSHHPTYDEWSGSGHFAVTEDMNPSGRINACGRCHSGSSRMALIRGENPLVTVTNDANVGITCVVCHDPHQTHVWTNVLTRAVETNQLRYALASTNDFFLTTTDIFTNKYNPNINLCAQCHNHRGASWSNSGRPPHHSPQYNMLLGTVGELPTGASRYRAAHATLIEKQCVGCHMPTKAFENESHPAMTGHSFKVNAYDSCLECHPLPEMLVDFAATVISSYIEQVKEDLDTWATTKSPTALRTKYGVMAWEYTVPGNLSTGSTGPNSTEQAQVPDNIKRARFNLYIVHHDASLGTHNAFHALSLLDAARAWVAEELAK